MKIVITGFTGYLGSNLAEYLLSKGYDIIGIIRENSSVSRVDRIIKYCKIYSNLQIDLLFKENTDITALINTATAYGRNEEKIEAIIEANYTFPASILKKFIKNKASLFINIGTSLAKLTSEYSLIKTQFSEFGKFISQEHDVKFANICLEQFYGTDEDDSKFISFLIDKFIKNENIKLTLGEQVRDIIHVSDVCSGIEIIIKSASLIKGYVDIPMGNGLPLSIRELVEKIKSLAKSNSNLLFGEIQYRKNECMYSVADLTFLYSLGWRPEISLETGLLEVIEHKRRKIL